MMLFEFFSASHQRYAFFGRVAQRLLHVDVFAGGDGVHHHLVVPVFGRRDQHGLDVFVGQQIFVVAVES